MFSSFKQQFPSHHHYLIRYCREYVSAIRRHKTVNVLHARRLLPSGEL